jgi:hypothetical protein
MLASGFNIADSREPDVGNLLTLKPANGALAGVAPAPAGEPDEGAERSAAAGDAGFPGTVAGM